ncbi:MAG: hypothetical protein ACE5F4_02190 [Candidatus Paceibacteria bacterium]
MSFREREHSTEPIQLMKENPIPLRLKVSEILGQHPLCALAVIFTVMLALTLGYSAHLEDASIARFNGG